MTGGYCLGATRTSVLIDALYDQLVIALAMTFVALALAPPPAWIDRAVQPPVVAWRLADVLGTPIVEGIAVNRDAAFGTLTVSVVDSRFDPPQMVRQRDLLGSRVRWLRAGTRDGLHRYEIAVDVVGPKGETAYLLLVRRAFQLAIARTVHGKNISPTVFRH
jgi:hypothetical protein